LFLWIFKGGAKGVGLPDLPGQRNQSRLETRGRKWKAKSLVLTRAKKKARRFEAAGFQSDFRGMSYEIRDASSILRTR
jgi:hypothetical protein